MSLIVGQRVKVITEGSLFEGEVGNIIEGRREHWDYEVRLDGWRETQPFQACELAPVEVEEK